MEALIKFFQNFSETENGKLTVFRNTVKAGLGTKAPESGFHLVIPYKEKIITIKYDVSLGAVGLIKCSLDLNKNAPNFEIYTKSHFMTLFSFSKNRFKFKSNNLHLNSILNTSSNILQLKEITKETQFELQLEGKFNEDTFVLKTEYTLLLEDKTSMLAPLISLFKELIDFYVLGYSEVNLKS